MGSKTNQIANNVWAIIAVPVLMVIALSAWAFSSPVSSSPDDDFHMVSIWCANGGVDGVCESSGDPRTRFVAEGLIESRCFVFLPRQSADCQAAKGVFEISPLIESDRGSFSANYPPGYYSFMHLFAGADIQFSILLMRVINVLIFVFLNIWLWISLPRRYRITQILMWLITMIPLGVFIIGSVNPSAWAITGVGISWLSLYALLADMGTLSRRQAINLTCLFLLSGLLAAGARADAAIYVIFGILVSFALTFRKRANGFKSYVLPFAMILICTASFLLAGQSAVIGEGLPPELRNPDEPQSLTGQLALLIGNAIQIPSLILGTFGYWDIGWSDTEMPIFTWVVTGAIFVSIIFSSLRVMARKHILIFSILAIALVSIPLYVLQKSLVPVGTQVQPRYLLPLLVILTGVALLPRRGFVLEPSTLQAWLVSLGLGLGFSLALHFNIRRYVTGEDVNSPNLNSNPEWWWQNFPSPMFVWVSGSVAFGLLLLLLLREVKRTNLELARWSS